MLPKAHQIPAEDNKDQVLERINAALTAAGHCTRERLPHGYKKDHLGCVIHVALRPLGVRMTVEPDCVVTNLKTAELLAECWGTRVNRCAGRNKRRPWEVDLPSDMQTFVERFDAGLAGYEHLALADTHR